MAELIFRHGAMNSAKTANLLMTAYNREEKDGKVLIMKPGVDTKGDRNLVSRIGLEREVNYVVNKNDSIFDLIKNESLPIKAIFVDEVQFLTEKQIDELRIIATVVDIKVITYGLKNDSNGNLFEGSRALFQRADRIEEIETTCMCGKNANTNARLINGKFNTNGKQIAIDGEDDDVEYVSVCWECFLKYASDLIDKTYSKEQLNELKEIIQKQKTATNEAEEKIQAKSRTLKNPLNTFWD